MIPPAGATAEGVDEQIRQLQADLHKVRSADEHSSTTKARYAAMIRQRVAASAPRTDPALAGVAAEATLPTITVRGELHGHVAMEGAPMVVGFVQVRVIDAFGLQCWHSGEAMIAAFNRDIDEVADDSNAMDPEEQAEAEARLLTSILEMERVHCAVVEASGGEYRDHADPRAVLGIDGPPPRE